MKNAIMQVTYFLNGSMVNMLFYCHILHIEKKWLFKRNSAIVLPLKFNLSGKFQCFNAIDGSITMLKNSWISKISIEMKNFKTFCEFQTSLCRKGIINHPPPPSHQIKQFLGFKKWCSANVFSDTNHKHIFGFGAEVYFL